MKKSDYIKSFLLHSLLLFGIIEYRKPVELPKGGGPVEVSIETDDKGNGVEATLKPQDEMAIGNCSNSYEGIGVKTMYDGEIYAVAQGSPAWKAGLRIGDNILSPTEIRGPKGTVVNVTVRKKDSEESNIIPITRDTICYEKI